MNRLSHIMDFQKPDELENVFKSMLSEPQKQKVLKKLCQSDDFTEDMHQVSECLLDILLKYCSYEIAPIEGEIANPFDDPFVGAALLTDSGHLLGAHRKVKQNENHAEPETLKRVLESIVHSRYGDLKKKAKKILKLISRAYRQKSWLQSDDEREEFVEYFSQAGTITREYTYREINDDSKLILLSTLELCRDFESQPACSHIISEFKPDAVFYACDDTNSKGQGRQILLNNGVRTIPNQNVDLNVQINMLFYSSINFLILLHQAQLEAQIPFQIHYIYANLLNLKYEKIVRQKRICINFEKNDAYSIYHANLGHFSKGGEATLPRNMRPNKKEVLFVSQFSSQFIEKFFLRSHILIGTVPGIIVTSDSPDKKEKDEIHYLNLLRAEGIEVYTNVLRKAEEKVLARIFIHQWSSVRSLRHIYIVVKSHGEYCSFSGNANDLSKQLVEQAEPKRISIFFHTLSQLEVQDLLLNLKGMQAFELNSGPLSLTSIELVPLTEFRKQNSLHEFSMLRNFLRRENLHLRCSIQPEPYNVKLIYSVKKLRKDMLSGTVDPILVDKDTLLELLDDLDWKKRQDAGVLLHLAIKRQPALLENFIFKLLGNGYRPDEWKTACSLLNALAKMRTYPFKEARESIIAILRDFSLTLEKSKNPFENSVASDVLWRLIAASCATVDAKSDIEAILGLERISKYIGENEFLMKELFFYAASNINMRHEILNFAFDILEKSQLVRNESFLKKILIRLQRLSSLFEQDLSEVCNKRISKLCQNFSICKKDFEAEKRICNFINDGGLALTLSLKAPYKYKAFSTYLFLRTTKQGEKQRGLRTSIESILRDNKTGRISDMEEYISWRGDKTPFAQLVLSEVPIDDLYSYLDAMAEDEDETIRWAALVLAFEEEYRKELIAKNPNRIGHIKAREAPSRIIEKIFKSTSHYWLQREFLSQFKSEHSGKNVLPIDAKIQLIDVPSAKKMIFEAPEDQIHPEVKNEFMKLRTHMKKILLILPPIEKNDKWDYLKAAETSSPALGIGSIASFLLSHGHDVELWDLHRFPNQATNILKIAQKFDYICFSVVTSTFKSTEHFVAQLKNMHRGKTPKVILGGHAVTLHVSDFLYHRTFQWDYLILGDGEKPLLKIVESQTPEELENSPEIICSSTKKNFTYHSTKFMNAKEWCELPWINRRVFFIPGGGQFEPNKTRTPNITEAHVVMARGCSWNCSFCTEAILRGKYGEIRRQVNDILEELLWLVEKYNTNRVYFIDDNLLPSLIAPKSKRNDRESINWTKEFFDGLLNIRKKLQSDGQDFRWRGIFKIEDFLCYEQRFDSWLELLNNTGCSLLAFGIEHGNEEKRQRLKGQQIKNEEIVNLLLRLRSNEIASKGYFIIGGYGETEKSADETIKFAVSSGLTLAYFALYKNFRELINKSNKNIDNPIQEKLLSFKCLTTDFTESIAKGIDENECVKLFGRAYDSKRLKESQVILKELKKLNFRFSELFKYNDYHDHLETINHLALVWEEQKEENIEASFIKSVQRAYFEFYLRKKFIEDFKWLVKKYHAL